MTSLPKLLAVFYLTFWSKRYLWLRQKQAAEPAVGKE
jgi:hypothetical protein